jgi:FdhD protein
MLSCPTKTEASTGSVVRDVVRHRGDMTTQTVDLVVEEVPVALVFNGISHAVMMATPIDLDEFALGFALSEGIVGRASDVFEIETDLLAEGAEVHLRVSQEAFMALKGRRRALAGRSGCGVCGIESIELLDLHPERIPPDPPVIQKTAVERAARELRDHQRLMHETGGIHAAAWCDLEGQIVQIFEDGTTRSTN